MPILSTTYTAAVVTHRQLGVDGLAKVVGVGNVFGFFGRGCESHMGGTVKVFQYFAPSRVFVRAATVALINDDQIEEFRRKLFVNVALFFGAGHSLVQRQINFIAFVYQLGGFIDSEIHVFDGDLTLDINTLDALRVGAEFGHRALERAKVVDHGLVDQDVAVGQKQDAFFCAALSQAPDDLKGGIGFAGAGGHDEHGAVLTLGNGFYCAVDGIELVVARCFAGCVIKLGDLAHCWCPALPRAVALPQLLRGRELF